MPLTPEQLEAVRALVAQEPSLGRPAIAERLKLQEHLVRAALRQLGHRAPAGRRGRAAPTPLGSAAWRTFSSDRRWLASLTDALERRASEGAGLSLEEVEELVRELRARG